MRMHKIHFVETVAGRDAPRDVMALPEVAL